MRVWTQIRSWLRTIVNRERSERDMDTELRFHLDAYTEDLVRTGVSREEAHRRARLEFGGFERAKEECRDATGTNFVDSLFQDLRYALRIFAKSPGFTSAAIVTIALGIGANAAIFGLVDSTFLRALPFSHPDRLVHLWTIESDGDTHTPTPQQYLAVRDSSDSYDHIAAAGWADYFYGGDGAILQNLSGFLVTSNWFSTLGIQPFLGRNFRDDEQTPGQDAVVMLSYDGWRTLFRSDPHIIGKRIVLNRRTVTVIGVLPQSVGPYYEDIAIFAPLVLDSYAAIGNLRAGKVRVQILARLKPEVTLAQARAEAEVISGRVARSDASSAMPDRLVVEDFGEMLRHPEPTVQNARRGLGMTAIAAAVVLLIACANVASLLLARGVRRQREVAVRAALGCSRGRMIRQLLTETGLLFFCGGVLALIATRWCEGLITTLAAGIVPGAYLQVNAHVFFVCLGGALLSALVFGLIPALQVTHVNLNDNLKDAAAKGAGSSQARGLRNALVSSQVALGMVLLVVFGLLMRSLLNVESSPLGYDPHGVLTASVRVPTTRYATSLDRARLMRDSLERIRLMPEVESAGIADSLPMMGANSAPLRIDASTPGRAAVEDEIWFVSVSPSYFSTLRVPILAGRSFQEQDTHSGVRTAIVNEAFAKRYFPDTNPIGRHLAFADSPATSIEIVGVVSNFRQRNPEEDLRPLAYFPISQMVPPQWSLAVRVRPGETGNLAARISNWLQPLDPQLYWEMGSMQQLLFDSESLTMRRPLIVLVASFGGLAILLVIVGVFAVTSYSVAERTREIGIRVALGAAAHEIAALVFREILIVAVTGLAVGVPCAFALAHFFPTEGIGWSGSGIFLYGVSRSDALTYFLAAALLLGVVFVAAWAPARRAMRVDPTVALRYE
jgi:predicted permease